MAIADVTIIPVGTAGPSVSAYVVHIHEVLESWKQKKAITVKLTPMSTLIEGELRDLFEVIADIHELPFNQGALRVCTNIRIDDRRDKPLRMDEKVSAVERRLHVPAKDS